MNKNTLYLLIAAAIGAAIYAASQKKKPAKAGGPGISQRIASVTGQMAQALAEDNIEIYEMLRLEREGIEAGIL